MREPWRSINARSLKPGIGSGQDYTKSPSNPAIAFTLVELLVVLAIIASLVVLAFPALANAKSRAHLVTCANNLKQVGVAFETWALSHSSQFPMNISPYRGGPPTPLTIHFSDPSMDAAPYLYTVFAVMSNELSTTKILVCPSDERGYHTNFSMHYTSLGPPPVAASSASGSAPSDNDPAYFNNFKISYFLGPSASSASPRMLLAGDRNIYGDHTTYSASGSMPNGGYGNLCGSGYWMGTNWPGNSAYPGWTSNLMHQGLGNVLLADHSVQQSTGTRFRDLCRTSGDVTANPGPNVLLFP